MSDALALLEQDRKKLAAKVQRLKAQLEAAENELSDTDAALRVFKRLGIAPTVVGAASDDNRGNSQAHVLAKLAASEAEAKAPKEVHSELTADGFNISADNVRTILSRLAKPDASGRAAVYSKDSRYWRNDDAYHNGDSRASADMDDDIYDFAPTSRPQPIFDDDLEVPF